MSWPARAGLMDPPRGAATLKFAKDANIVPTNTACVPGARVKLFVAVPDELPKGTQHCRPVRVPRDALL
jgi:hypothetical protein